MAAIVLRNLLRTAPAGRFCARCPRVTAGAIAAAGLVASDAMRSWGLTEIFGALLVGMVIPTGVRSGQWSAAVGMVARLGRWLVPVFFVVTGITVFARQFPSMPWSAIAIATTLAIVGKVLGSYVGARLGGQSHLTGLRLGILLNTRGLTELVVLQLGYNAGILTPTLFLALVVMALITTVMTGPAFSLIDSGARRRRLAASSGRTR